MCASSRCPSARTRRRSRSRRRRPPRRGARRRTPRPRASRRPRAESHAGLDRRRVTSAWRRARRTRRRDRTERTRRAWCHQPWCAARAAARGSRASDTVTRPPRAPRLRRGERAHAHQHRDALVRERNVVVRLRGIRGICGCWRLDARLRLRVRRASRAFDRRRAFRIHHTRKTHAVQIDAVRLALGVQRRLLLKHLRAPSLPALRDELDLRERRTKRPRRVSGGGREARAEESDAASGVFVVSRSLKLRGPRTR